MKFHFSSNNGVIAVIREDHAELYATVKRAGGDPLAAGCRVFTFCSQERMDSGIAERMVFTGTYDDLDRFVKVGHQIVRGMGQSGWDGYVPFSNGIQYGYCLGDVEGLPPSVLAELRYVTTLGDVLSVFGADTL